MPEFLPEWTLKVLLTVIFVISFLLVIKVTAQQERRERRIVEAHYAQAVRRIEVIISKEKADAQPPTLEQEISDVSGTLTRTVSRLRDISTRAQAFEAEVRELVARADAAQATAQLNEEQAQKIALLLTSQTEQKLKEEIEKLTKAHNEQIEGLKKSGTKTAWLTFGLGALVGFLLNLLTAVMVG
ncbi:hypothetical protein ABZ647_17745 [Micromonospora aurantiaca]|uniref:hypothetical protein n=1 Tax=Micromonospora aurantiaca (nom. illeg.) TaxID=47850 RepID=UPI0033E8BF14